MQRPGQRLDCASAWEGNGTWACFFAFAWQGSGGERLFVTVNYALNQSQCYVRLPFADLGNRYRRLTDLLGDATYDRDENELQACAFYLHEPAWKASVFELSTGT